MQRLVLFALLLPLTLAAAQDADGDGLSDALEHRLGSDPAAAETFTEVQTDPVDPGLGGFGQAPDFVKCSAANVAGDRWLWKLDFAGGGDWGNSLLVVYVDLDDDPTTGRQDAEVVRGSDIMYVFMGWAGSESVRNPAYRLKRSIRARYRLVDHTLYIADDTPLGGDAKTAACRVRVLVQRPGQASDSTEFTEVRIPRSNRTDLPPVKLSGGLDDRGMPGFAAKPAGDVQGFPRERPPLPLRDQGKLDRDPTVDHVAVPVTVREEHGRDRSRMPLSFGFPLPEGQVFRPSNLAVSNDHGRVPSDVAATGFWPDGSLKWVLIETHSDLGASAEQTLTVEYGRQVQHDVKPGISLRVVGDRVSVETGVMRAEIALKPLRFEAFEVPAGHPVVGPSPFILKDTNGGLYESDPAKMVVEYAGLRRLQLRFEAPYHGEDRDLFRVILRLTFHADSSAIDVAHTLVDDCLDWEFTDFKSLATSAQLVQTPVSARYAVGSDFGAPRIYHAPSIDSSLAVPSDQSYVLDGTTHDGRTLGAVQVQAADRSGCALGMIDFWQRYPKCLATYDHGLDIQLFPDQAGPAGPPRDLPDHLAFPYVEGNYRFKWGMSTTDRYRLVPHDGEQVLPDEALAAALDACQPVVAVVPGTWYEQTGALGDMVAADGELFQAWDEAFARTFNGHLELKEQKREYGFFNWGDWHGEREHNWGNNEYDLPHGLWLQFARTGQTRYYRLALAGARHQADVDLLHAYPDPSVVGGDHPHAVCHTGEISEQIVDRRWSMPFGWDTAAANGHTWASGLCEAWYLAGEPRAMEGGLELGEHIAWFMAPQFKALGTHERSAGWSAQAIAALYRATLDPEYLRALKQIIEVAYREQKFDLNGSWPHLLPDDHAAGVKGATGNVSFLIGILLEGIEDEADLAQDSRGEKSIAAAVQWLQTMWLPDKGAFQYTSSPGFRDRTTESMAMLNNLMLGPILREAERTGDPQLLELGTRGFAATVEHGLASFGKSFGVAAHCAPEIMARLKRLHAEQQTYGQALTQSYASLQQAKLLQAAPPTQLNLRGPTEKKLWFRHAGGAAEVVFSRTGWGAKPKDEPTGWIKLTSPAGEVAASDTFDTDTVPWSYTAKLPAKAAEGVWSIVIHDDLRGRWDVKAPGPLTLDATAPIHFGGLGRVKFWLRVPAGTEQFTLRLSNPHGGQYGAVFLGPDGKVKAEVTKLAPATRSLQLEVKAGAPQRDERWSVVLFAPSDLVVALEGIPPHLATSPDGWFEPE